MGNQMGFGEFASDEEDRVLHSMLSGDFRSLKLFLEKRLQERWKKGYGHNHGLTATHTPSSGNINDSKSQPNLTRAHTDNGAVMMQAHRHEHNTNSTSGPLLVRSVSDNSPHVTSHGKTSAVSSNEDDWYGLNSWVNERAFRQGFSGLHMCAMLSSLNLAKWMLENEALVSLPSTVSLDSYDESVRDAGHYVYRDAISPRDQSYPVLPSTVYRDLCQLPPELRYRENGFTPLHLSIIFTNSNLIVPMVMIFLRAGASANETTSKAKWTPLMFAARRGDPALIHTLLEFGARIDDKAADGTDALDIAKYRGSDYGLIFKTTIDRRLAISQRIAQLLHGGSKSFILTAEEAKKQSKKSWNFSLPNSKQNQTQTLSYSSSQPSDWFMPKVLIDVILKYAGLPIVQGQIIVDSIPPSASIPAATPAYSTSHTGRSSLS